jgi:hypothetical protein
MSFHQLRAMIRTPRVPCRDGLLDGPSQTFAAALFQRFPWLREHAEVEIQPGQDTGTLYLSVPAPSGNDRVGILLWMEDGTPSLMFGGWHTHADCWLDDSALQEPSGVEGLVRLLEGILEDRFLLCEDVGAPEPHFPTLLNASDQAALLDELTSPYGTGRVRLLSWSGRLDRELGAEDFGRDCERRP